MAFALSQLFKKSTDLKNMEAQIKTFTDLKNMEHLPKIDPFLANDFVSLGRPLKYVIDRKYLPVSRNYYNDCKDVRPSKYIAN